MTKKIVAKPWGGRGEKVPAVGSLLVMITVYKHGLPLMGEFLPVTIPFTDEKNGGRKRGHF